MNPKQTEKRSVKSIDFPKELLEQLRKEAESEGLKVSTYIRHLIITHPNRETNWPKKLNS